MSSTSFQPWPSYRASLGCALWLLFLGLLGASLPPLEVEPRDIPNRGRLFVAHEEKGRSGHGNQALVECRNGRIISFYSSTSGELMEGHSNSGWTEYKVSDDGGLTWSTPRILAYSKAVYDARSSGPLHAALVGEAVTAPDGTVIALVGRYTAENWRRTTPVYLVSRDHGETWSEPRSVAPGVDVSHIGREHAVLVHQGVIYVLFDSGTHNSAKNGTGHKLYVSSDNGASFQHRSDLPFAETAWYGTMGFIPGGRLIAYVYNSDEERETQYAVSDDLGVTWSPVRRTTLAKALRNPQLSGELNGVYYLHGRSGTNVPEPKNLVLYRSVDGINWDDGTFLNVGPNDADSYSTNEIIGKYGSDVRKRWLLLQSSIAYDGNRKVNLHHWSIGRPSPGEAAK